MLLNVKNGVAALNGDYPANIMYNMTPKLHMSAAGPDGLSAITSGAIQSSVPTKVPLARGTML